MKILLLEDDKTLAETIQEALEDEGYICHIAPTGNRALDMSYEESYDFYLLDINVPGILGTKLLEELRGSGDTTPAIFITSMGDEASVLKGYQSGGDDYIRKPFTIAEMLARIKVLMRRVYGTKESSVVISESISFDLVSNELRIDEEIERIPKKEANLLAFFCKNRGRIVSKDEIIDAVWPERLPSDTVIRVYIKNIKKRIGKEKITNIKSVGYRFESL